LCILFVLPRLHHTKYNEGIKHGFRPMFFVTLPIKLLEGQDNGEITDGN
jgi:hypothetical protein